MRNFGGTKLQSSSKDPLSTNYKYGGAEISFTSNINYVSEGVPETDPGFTNLLEHSQNIQKQFYSITFYYSERTQVGISQSEGAWSRVQGASKSESPCRPLPLESQRMLLFPTIMCANTRIHMQFCQCGRLT